VIGEGRGHRLGLRPQRSLLGGLIDAVEDVLLHRFAKPLQRPDFFLLGRRFQLLARGNAQFLVQAPHALGPQPLDVHQVRQGRRGAALQLLQEGQRSSLDDGLDLAREVLADVLQLAQVRAVGHHVRHAARLLP
jgi:hypothetical protein